MVMHFSKSCAIYDYIFVNGQSSVFPLKHLGIYFDNDLKWQSNSDYVYGKLKQRFYAFSQFCHFKTSPETRKPNPETLFYP